MRDGFSRLIAAFGEARLRQHMAERRVLRVAAPGFTELLRFDEFSAALAQGVFPAERVRVVCGRVQADPERLGMVRNGQIVVPVLEQLARQGSTVVVNALDHFLPTFWDFCREGEALVGEPLSAIAIATFGPESGFSPHYDGGDLLIIQLAGTKHWHFHGEPVTLPYPPRGSSGEVGPVTATEVLRAGEIMLVPAGVNHHCTADGASMHLGIMWRHRRGASLAHRLLKQAAIDAMLNTPVELMPSEEAVAERLAACKARLIEMIGAFDAPALLEIPRPEEIWPETRPSTVVAASPRLAVELMDRVGSGT